MKKQLVALTILVASIGQLSANSVIDSFNNVSGSAATNGAALTLFSTTATAGGVGFTTGYDQANSAVDVLRTNDLTVSLANYASGQTNSANHWSIAATTASTGLARRAKTRDVVPLTGTIWFSFLASLQNTNGDVALTFNGAVASGSFNTTPGMRVGLGNPTRVGALGVGTVVANANLSNITNNVNGAITANGFIPTNGTAGLVLGRISTDVETGFPKVEVWYNPDVPNQASLPAPTLSFIDTNSTFVTTTITRVGYQVVRGATAVQNEVIDNVKLSDEPNGFDIVYKNAPLPLPLLNVSIAAAGSESGPTNLQFAISSDRILLGPLTVNYRLSGIATNGFDGSGFVGADYTDTNFNTGTQISSITIPAGQSNATIIVAVIDDVLPEGDESVIFTLESSSDYIFGIGSATGVILENNDANASVQYMFTRTLAPQVWDTNLTASAFSAAGVGGGFSTTAGYFISPDASIRAAGDSTAGNAIDAVANGDFMTFSVSPILGRSLAITNLQFKALYGNFLFQEPSAAAAVIFLRSSLDNFAADLGTWTLQPDNVLFPNAWYDLSLTLGGEFTNLIGGVEFRLYIYDDTTQNQVGVRVDDLYLRGATSPAVGVQQIGVTATAAEAAEPAASGAFTISRAGATTDPLTVYYSISGTASNGVDYVLLPGSAIIPIGQSNVVVTVAPIDDELIEPSETVQLSLLASTNYGIVATFSATVNIADDGDFGGLIGYLFNEANNSVASLAAIAAAGTRQPDKVEGLNAAAGPGIGNFGANNTAGVGHGYATATFHSSPSTLFIRGEFLAKNAIDSVAQSNYFSFVLSPKPGFALTLTNFTAYFKMISVATETTWAFLRSSIDDFAADIGSTAISGTATADPFQFWSTPLNLTNRSTAVEFRIYFYNDTSTIIRLDDVGFQGFAVGAAVRPAITNIAVANGSVTVSFTGAASDAAASFKLQSAATVGGTYLDDNTAVLSGTAGSYQATTSVNGATRFYKIRR